MPTCNCTIPLTNPDACLTCTTKEGMPGFRGGQPMIPWTPVHPTMTPDRVREIIRDEIGNRDRATDLRRMAREEASNVLHVEMQNYVVDINEQQLSEFIRSEMKKFEREFTLTDAEIERIAKLAVGPKVIELIDNRVKAALASLGRIIGKFSIDKI